MNTVFVVIQISKSTQARYEIAVYDTVVQAAKLVETEKSEDNLHQIIEMDRAEFERENECHGV